MECQTTLHLLIKNEEELPGRLSMTGAWRNIKAQGHEQRLIKCRIGDPGLLELSLAEPDKRLKPF